MFGTKLAQKNDTFFALSALFRKSRRCGGKKTKVT
jgi:hypothetical protein